MQKSTAQRIAGVHPNQLRRYVTGENEMPARVAVALAKRARVSLDWLLAGEGPREGKAPLDEALMREVIQHAEKILAEDKKSLPPAKKAELIVLIYKLLVAKPAATRSPAANTEELRSLIRRAG